MKLIDELKRDEGLRLQSYRCIKGKLTWGYGRNLDDVGLNKAEVEALLKGFVTDSNPNFKIKGETAAKLLDKYGSKQYAEYLLENDMKTAVEEVGKAFPFYHELNEPRKEVLANMVFNMGLPRFLKFDKTLKAIKRQDFKEAARQMLCSKWQKVDFKNNPKSRAAMMAKIMETGEELCS